MAQEELYEDLDKEQSLTEKYLGLSLKKFLKLVAIVLVVGVYLGVLLFGTNSLQVYMGLQDYEEYLQSEIVRLRNENAELQKEYFELQEITVK